MSAGMRLAERAARGDPNTILPIATAFDRKCHVRITGALDVASNLYPAVFIYRIPVLSTTIQKWIDGEVCRIETLNGEALTNGRRYSGVIVGRLNPNYNPLTDPAPASWDGLPLVIVGRTPPELDESIPPDCSAFHDLKTTKHVRVSPINLDLTWNGTKWTNVATVTINGFAWTVSWNWPNGSCCPVLAFTKGTGTDTVTISIPGVCKSAGGVPYMSFTTQRPELTGVANPLCGVLGLNFTVGCGPGVPLGGCCAVPGAYEYRVKFKTDTGVQVDTTVTYFGAHPSFPASQLWLGSASLTDSAGATTATIEWVYGLAGRPCNWGLGLRGTHYDTFGGPSCWDNQLSGAGGACGGQFVRRSSLVSPNECTDAGFVSRSNGPDDATVPVGTFPVGNTLVYTDIEITPLL